MVSRVPGSCPDVSGLQHQAVRESMIPTLYGDSIEPYEYIEPEAIQQLVSHGTASWTLSFELPEHQVAITNEGAVLVDGAERRHLTKSL